MKIRYEEPKIGQLVPRPLFCKGIAEPVRVLDGSWKIKHTAEPEKFAGELPLDDSLDTWEEIPVPSDMGAYRNKVKDFVGKYVYKKLVRLEETRTDCDYILRFEGVNGFAKIYIDGEFVMEHENAFVSWNVNITDMIKGKGQFLLTVCLDDVTDQVSSYNHGGILHSVLLYVLPKNYYTSVHTSTVFDKDYINSTLKLFFATQETSDSYRYEALLIAPDQTVVKEIDLNSAGYLKDGYRSLEIPMENPLKWDAEHPWLYTLRLHIFDQNEKIEEIEHRFGFREISQAGNQLFVNGREVKLRGVCRHEISPLHGRCLTKELIDEDVALFKEANCNYIRTSHYPPSEYFLQRCDEEGIYVEDELALAFIARTLPYTQRDPKETRRYLTHFTEVLARDYSHPCVLIWSLCNESFGGYNFDLLNRFVHRVDPSRPTKFSYPMTMREEHEAVDIWSIHYTNLEEDLARKCDNVSVGYTPGYDKPVLHDEYAHIPCYNRTEHRRDPNIRNFWGESIKKFWDKIWNTKGALGGAIWAGIDETNSYNGGNTCLEWGIIDVWRRRKPEFYMTRKAYSPIVIPGEGAVYQDGFLFVGIENRFCHTSLSEVQVEWEYADTGGIAMGPQAEPRETGVLRLAIGQCVTSPASKLALTFYDAFHNKVDEFLLPVNELSGNELPVNELPIGEVEEEGVSSSCGKLTCKEEDREVVLEGKDFRLSFDKETGLLCDASYQGRPVLVGGPYLNVPYIRLGGWKRKNFFTELDRDNVKLTISGSYGREMEVSFHITVRPDGTIDTNYVIDRLYVKMPKQVKLRVGVDCGGLDELGIYYLAHPAMDTLQWKRKGLWTVYPEDHIARCEGTAKRRSEGSVFGEKPHIPWSEEMKSFILNGRYDVDYKGTNDFRSLKEHIYSAKLSGEGSGAAIEAVSDGNHSVRLEIAEPEELVISDRDERIHYHGTWFEMEDYSGSLNNTEMWSKEAGAYAECRFTGTGAVWYGPVDTIYGMAKVYVDGELMDGAINQRVNGVDFPGSAAGYDKKYGYPLYSVTGLPFGEHTIRIEVSGEKAQDAGDYYTVIDYLRIIRREMEEPVRFIINNDYNYPHIAWGNYSKPPILIQEGYSNFASMKLTGKTD
ncbi:MAG TPA: hypothetical protein GXX75_19410 [Clostridiales bacterium]|nr:hypothetical protein [Clostridiales bacterium]